MKNYTTLLQRELICALGCTEPITIALASAKAREVLGSFPSLVKLYCSRNIIKNVQSVTVPNTNGLKGLEAACAIGLVAGKSSLGLEVLSQVKPEEIEKTKVLLQQNLIQVSLKKEADNLDVELYLEDKFSHSCEVEIKNRHTQFVKIKKDGQSILEEDLFEQQDSSLMKQLSVHDILEYASQVDLEEVESILRPQISHNLEISEEGLTGEWGASIGKICLLQEDSLRAKIKAYAAAASDARMSGCSMPVVINAGSGNQGITCSLPLVVYARETRRCEEELIRALLVSNLVALHIKRYIGRLSAFCGVTSAGIAASAGIAYMETKNEEIVNHTIGNGLMILSGMVCDGAKPSCAAKISAALDAGYTGFQMALKNHNFQPGEGLMKEDIEQTIQAIGRLGAKGMKETDIEILEMMLE